MSDVWAAILIPWGIVLGYLLLISIVAIVRRW